MVVEKAEETKKLNQKVAAELIQGKKKVIDKVAVETKIEKKRVNSDDVVVVSKNQKEMNMGKLTQKELESEDLLVNEKAAEHKESDDNNDDWKDFKDVAKMVKLAIAAAVESAIIPLLIEIQNNAAKNEEQIDKLSKEIHELKKMANSSVQKTTLMSDLFKNNVNVIAKPKDISRTEISQEKRSNLSLNEGSLDIQLAKRTVGFFPINPDDIECSKTSCPKSMSESEKYNLAATRTIQDYMSTTLGMPDSVIARLQFVRSFYPSSGSGSRTLYAEFKDEDDKAIIRRYAMCLSGTDHDDPKIVQYIPKSLQIQHNSMQQVAFAARRMQPKLASKIWFADKMELRLKPVGSRIPWSNTKPIDIDEVWSINPPIFRSNIIQPKNQEGRNKETGTKPKTRTERNISQDLNEDMDTNQPTIPCRNTFEMLGEIQAP